MNAQQVWGRAVRIFSYLMFSGVIPWGMVAWVDISTMIHAYELDFVEFMQSLPKEVYVLLRCF
jgi:hypothetical protein